MRKLKINFFEFWGHFEEKNNWIWNNLSVYYDLELSNEPDIIFYSVWGNPMFTNGQTPEDRLKLVEKNPNCIKVFYSPENIRPNFDECDISLTFDYSDNPKNIRLPYYCMCGKNVVFSEPFIDLNLLKTNIKQSTIKTKFCCVIISNPHAVVRNEFFQKLSKYKKVDSAGNHLNNIGYNIGGSVTDKLNFIKDYKFVISFENNENPGYTTEKIVEAMYVSSIPIYWGNPLVYNDFNTESFINTHEFENMDWVIAKIIEIDNNEDLYNEIQKKPNLINDNVQDFQNFNILFGDLKDKIEELLIERNL